MFTITLEWSSRSAGIRVHDALETVITMSRNMHIQLMRSGQKKWRVVRITSKTVAPSQ